ncbi:alpha/beta fold hydrolase [Jannaschia seohaensis]|uniref:Pimeloyl-ACP methyl ester carboxylesterase n=1 Tax=Jannaschia seohaensis TaxID=475081 RepID=A0A2Y9C743_9RHOB|nr:alpha/beta hydrolase [Jannaschia seohaensis]PWJ20277.1 pimeloyl-ACP methyl ester carboxylesterase [Jannaschia seohaensis]SSA44293.1 Pimeloyl-ACP methyl ester carboxylesterase [Jannaschia seohaensis]
MRRIALAIAGLVLLLPAGGALLQGAASALDRSRLPPPGEIVTAGGAGLHVYCSGPPEAPPVFLETGMGVVSDAWVRVQDDLSEDHRVCRYDRAGTGHSARFDGPKDAGATADRLAALAQAVGVERPMVLVGHSYGGLVARVFAHRYPERVAGLVLVDSSHEEMGERLPPAGRDMVDDILSAFGKLSIANRFGVLRITGAPGLWMAGLEDAARDRAAAVYASVAHMAAAAEEAAAWRDGASTGLARDIETLGNLPMRVLVADEYPDGLVESWIALQRDLAGLSAQSRLTVVSGADHYGLVQNPEHAARVAGEIRALWQSVGPE